MHHVDQPEVDQISLFPLNYARVDPRWLGLLIPRQALTANR